MPEASVLVPLLVLGPLAVAVVAALLPAAARRLTVTGSAVVGLVLAVVIAATVASHGTVVTRLGPWSAPIGIELAVDGLAAVLLLLVAVVGLAVLVAAGGDERSAGGAGFWPLSSMLLGAVNAVVVAADLFNAYVALELLTVVAVGMIALGGRVARRPALRYLLVAVLGSLAFLMAVALLYAERGSLAIVDVGPPDGGTATPTVLAAVAIGTLGLAVKTALWPLHGWLPPAHAGAPAAVSPLMSALVVKGSLVLLVRLWADVAGLSLPDAAFVALGVLGAAGMLHASLVALREPDLKRVVALSTVAQMGYLAVAVAVLGLGGDAAPLAWQGLALLLVGHGLAKSAMFLAAGSLARAHGTTRVAGMRGAVREHPMEVMTIGAAGVVLAGLPPGVAFAGKWQLVTAALGAGAWWWVVVLLVGGLLTAGYVGVVLSTLLGEPEPAEPQDEESDDDGAPARRAGEHRAEPVRGSARWRWAALSLVLLAVALGLRPLELAELVLVGVPAAVIP